MIVQHPIYARGHRLGERSNWSLDGLRYMFHSKIQRFLRLSTPNFLTHLQDEKDSG